MWDKEEITENATLFRRVPNKLIDGEVVAPGAFCNGKNEAGENTNSMSSNWARYATALQTRDQVTKQDPREYGVVEMVVSEIKRPNGLPLG